MLFNVVQRTWHPDTVPGQRGPGVLRVETIATYSTWSEAEVTAKTTAAGYAAHGYNKEQGYWWGRDDRFRYTFAIETR
jgi:hypothetical protein